MSSAKKVSQPTMQYIFLFAILLHVTEISSSFFSSQTTKAASLQKYNVDPKSVTVSGISSGGAMAVQLHFSSSKTVKGSGVFAGGCYACAYQNPLNSASCMQAPDAIDLPSLISKTDSLATKGLIDPLGNLNGSKVYVFHGVNDQVVKQGGGIKVSQMYKHYGADVSSKFDSPANHGQPVDGNGFGGSCESLNIAQHFINDCAYNGAYEMFNWLYGDMKRPEKGFKAEGQILDFNQKEFFSQSSLFTGMAETAFIYIPKSCQSKNVTCKLHIAFHGCLANEQLIGKDYATKTQYDDVAEMNNIIVVYPQTTATLTSPSGCWDWFGYTGPTNYLTKSGIQINGVNKMIERIAS